MIKSPDREVIRRQAVIHRVGHSWSWSCDRCSFYREWSTEVGAVNGVAAHLLQVHRARLTLEGAGP